MLFITPAQVSMLADAIHPRFRALIRTAAYSGMRAGELSALRLSRVDFLRRRINVVESHSEVKGTKSRSGPLIRSNVLRSVASSHHGRKDAGIKNPVTEVLSAGSTKGASQWRQEDKVPAHRLNRDFGLYGVCSSGR
jgi:integrase